MSDIVKEVVGTSFALVVGLSDNQQITFQSGFAEDEDDSVIHARIDRLMAIARRSELIAQVPKLKDERAKLVDEQTQRRADEKEADAVHDAVVAEIKGRKQATFDAGYTAHVQSGRQSAYEPRGKDKNVILNCQSELDKMKNEREAHMQQRAVYHQRVDARVAQIDEKLAEAASLGAT